VLWPTELKRRPIFQSKAVLTMLVKTACKCRCFFQKYKIFCSFSFKKFTFSEQLHQSFGNQGAIPHLFLMPEINLRAI
jgi:hypothetical protein